MYIFEGAFTILPFMTWLQQTGLLLFSFRKYFAPAMIILAYTEKIDTIIVLVGNQTEMHLDDGGF